MHRNPAAIADFRRNTQPDVEGIETTLNTTIPRRKPTIITSRNTQPDVEGHRNSQAWASASLIGKYVAIPSPTSRA